MSEQSIDALLLAIAKAIGNWKADQNLAAQASGGFHDDDETNDDDDDATAAAPPAAPPAKAPPVKILTKAPPAPPPPAKAPADPDEWDRAANEMEAFTSRGGKMYDLKALPVEWQNLAANFFNQPVIMWPPALSPLLFQERKQVVRGLPHPLPWVEEKDGGKEFMSPQAVVSLWLSIVPARPTRKQIERVRIAFLMALAIAYYKLHPGKFYANQRAHSESQEPFTSAVLFSAKHYAIPANFVTTFEQLNTAPPIFEPSIPYAPRVDEMPPVRRRRVDPMALGKK